MKLKLIYLLAAIFALSASIQGCDKNPDGKDPNGNDPNRPPLEVSVGGNISVDNFVDGAGGTVAFNRFPATVNEWKEVREKIGKTIPGAIALQIMACELYRRNNTAGIECLKLNTSTAKAVSYSNLLKGVIDTRPYQFAAYLQGASWDNGYNPTKPYTITVAVTPTSSVGYSNDYQTNIYHLFIKSNGHEVNGGLQPASVMITARPGEPGEGKYYIISELSSIFLQCKEKSFSVPFNGLD